MHLLVTVINLIELFMKEFYSSANHILNSVKGYFLALYAASNRMRKRQQQLIPSYQTTANQYTNNTTTLTQNQQIMQATKNQQSMKNMKSFFNFLMLSMVIIFSVFFGNANAQTVAIDCDKHQSL